MRPFWFDASTSGWHLPPAHPPPWQPCPHAPQLSGSVSGFEVHPASLLFLGYDGAVDPTPYLDAWRRLLDVHFPAGVAWAPQPLHSLLPPPGAMLLQSTDISTASGLDPGSLEQALAPPPGDALLGGGTRRTPQGRRAQLSR